MSEQTTQSAVVYEVAGVCDSRGWLHGRDHITADAGTTTLCGLRQRGAGGRSDILLLQSGQNRGYTSWRIAFKCRRCENSRKRRGVPVDAI